MICSSLISYVVVFQINLKSDKLSKHASKESNLTGNSSRHHLTIYHRQTCTHKSPIVIFTPTLQLLTGSNYTSYTYAHQRFTTVAIIRFNR